jgi:hypothetical protein
MLSRRRLPVFVRDSSSFDASTTSAASHLVNLSSRSRLRLLTSIVLDDNTLLRFSPRSASVLVGTSRVAIVLDDARLGVSLGDRIVDHLERTHSHAAELATTTTTTTATPPPPHTLRVWLDGTFGPTMRSLSPATDNNVVAPTFLISNVDAFVDDVDGASAESPPPALLVERPPEHLAIVAMRPIHCARGSTRCTRCQSASVSPPRFRLLNLNPDGVECARPVISIGDRHCVFDVLRSCVHGGWGWRLGRESV